MLDSHFPDKTPNHQAPHLEKSQQGKHPECISGHLQSEGLSSWLALQTQTQPWQQPPAVSSLPGSKSHANAAKIAINQVHRPLPSAPPEAVERRQNQLDRRLINRRAIDKATDRATNRERSLHCLNAQVSELAAQLSAAQEASRQQQGHLRQAIESMREQQIALKVRLAEMELALAQTRQHKSLGRLRDRTATPLAPPSASDHQPHYRPFSAATPFPKKHPIAPKARLTPATARLIPEPKTVPTTYVVPQSPKQTRLAQWTNKTPYFITLMVLGLVLAFSISAIYASQALLVSFETLVKTLLPPMGLAIIFSLAIAAVWDCRR